MQLEIKNIATTLQQTFCEYFSLSIWYFVSKGTVRPLINKDGKHCPEVRTAIKSAQLWTLQRDTGPPSAKSLCVVLAKLLHNSMSVAHFSSSVFVHILGASEES